MMRRMVRIESDSDVIVGGTVTVSGVPATVEEVDGRGRVRARLANGAEVVGVVARDKAWPPAGMESKVSPAQSVAALK